MRIVIIASGQAYQDAAALSASTYAINAGPGDLVSVLLPEGEPARDLLNQNSKAFGFALSRFPFRLVSDKKFTSQLKCQAYCFAASSVPQRELVFLLDADTCCLRSLVVPPELRKRIESGAIGLGPDIADHHSKLPADPWYLTPEERLTYVNSGVILASSTSLPLFDCFRQLSEQPEFLRGPFNDQKVINFALGRLFHDKLVLLDEAYNCIGPPFSPNAMIGHCAGGAGFLGTQRRKAIHENLCAGLVEAKNRVNRSQPMKAARRSQITGRPVA